ncbi:MULTISPECIES: glycosyltransferase family 4 protein [Bacillaceae]|uniref:glycosyltransferase family 4 protein n=1 Tax=Bacillaceae TaxID=186817 RepID=UPI000C771A70|nr:MULTISPECIES: glycosyltransferase family 4 protein [Bacillaceae]PLR68569.1 glycosyltransferase family 1 protein [Bacillus sp. UMB0893]
MKNSVLFATTISRTVEAFLIPHILYFLEKGYKVGVASNTQENKLENLEKLGVTIHHVPFSRAVTDKGNVVSYKIIKNIIKHYHILHLHTPISSFVTRMAASKQHTIIYTAHGFHFNENGTRITNFLFFAAEKIAGFKTNKLIVTNKDDLAAANKVISKQKVQYVGGVGVDTSVYNIDIYSEKDKEDLKHDLKLDLNKKIITHIAEFNQNKRQIDVLDACEIIKQKTENFIILLVGEGEDFKDIQKKIYDRKLDAYIKCLGFRDDIPRILSITDIGLLVSIREGLSRSIMEMMAMNIPVIGTNIRGNRDLITHEENGYLVPIKNPHLLAEKCLQLLNSENLCKQYGESGKRKIEHQHSIHHVLEQMELVYMELELLRNS